MRYISFLILLLVVTTVHGQIQNDPWILSQLSRVAWQRTFVGVLADYHPVTIMLASDSSHVAGYLRHQGDDRVHKLHGDWVKKSAFQLQERDEFDRLTGYLRGSITGDLLKMEWISADQSRMFDIVAYPSTLIKIKNFKPAAEWIKVDVVPEMLISVQKMDYGIVSGIVNRNGVYSRFEGYCLDGTCSLWNTVIQNSTGAPVKVQMQQKDATIYKAVLDGKEYSASILAHVPLAVRKHDNSMGFLDFVYPQFDSPALQSFLSKWIDKSWDEGVVHLSSINQPGSSGRLVHRSSGWMEILDAGQNYVSGMITYINPGSTRREGFIWIKREDIYLSTAELLNTPEDLVKASEQAMKKIKGQGDEDYLSWLRSAGYDFLIPSKGGAILMTEFNMIYGDDIQLIPVTESRAFIKKKYWKYFDW